MDKTALGDRMKRYEGVSDTSYIQRMPLMIRLDGKGFSKFTKGLEKPMDESLRLCMEYAAYELVKKVEGCRLAYVQSDEITLLLVDYSTNVSQAWFNYRANKVTSIASGICTAAFIKAALKYMPEHLAKKGFPVFDARPWNIPKEEVNNNFLWRQQDATRNSIQGLGQFHFKHKELQGKNSNQIQELLFKEKGINYNDEPVYYKRGFSLFKMDIEVEFDLDVEGREQPETGYCTRRKIVSDLKMPILSKDTWYVERWLEPSPDYTVEPESYVILEDLNFSTGEC